MLATASAIPTDGYLPDRGCELIIEAPSANSGTVRISDSLGLGGRLLPAAGGTETYRAARNTICFRDFYLKGSSSADKVNVTITER